MYVDLLWEMNRTVLVAQNATDDVNLILTLNKVRITTLFLTWFTPRPIAWSAAAVVLHCFFVGDCVNVMFQRDKTCGLNRQ